MAKRRAVADSDDEGGSEQHSKRSRTTESDEEDQEQPRAPRRSNKGKGKERARTVGSDMEDDDDGDEMGDVAPDEDEEKKFEEEHEERIRERLMNKSKTQGGIAEMGIIESLEMTQFMCHKYLTFSLGPQINFIIGHNGSGKSAVLSALTVALGGKATSTGRGSGLKSFIREGQSVSEVSVQLKNQGEEAYKPKEYGKSIIIQRRFTKDGASSYKIRSREGKLISTKREELQAICDHMNIQVDNPMNILTQDSARQFLSASSPADKYKFFLKGTQLSQLSEEYQTCMENISQTAKVLTRKAEVIPDLQEAYEEAQARFEEAEKAREQRHKADELKKELAWAHVATKEAELTGKLTEVANIEHRVGKAEESVKQAEDKRATVENQVAAYEEELEALGNVNALTTRKEELSTKGRANKTKLASLRSDEKQINDSLAGVNATITGLENQIADEHARAETRSRGKRDKTAAQLQEANAELADKEAKQKHATSEKLRLFGEAEASEKEARRLRDDQGQLRQRIIECDEQMRRCDEMQNSKVAQFGNNMDAALQHIRAARWHGQPPVGPFGLYVKVKDSEKWGQVLRIVIGGLMSSFALTDPRDRPTLAAILQKTNNRHCQIIISEVDLFDYSEGEPPERYLTVLRALEVSDPYVLRQLINTAHIENQLLAPTRREADQLLLSLNGGGVALAADLYRVVRFSEGGGQSTVINDLKTNDPRQQLFRNSNAGAERQRWLASRTEYSNRLADIDRRIPESTSAPQRARAEAKNFDMQEQQYTRRMRELRNKISDLQKELNEDLPVNIQALQDALQEQQTEKESILAQFEHIAREKEKVNAEQRPIVAEQEDLRVQIAEFGAKQTNITDNLSAAVAERMAQVKAVEHYQGKAEAERQKLGTAQKTAEDVQKEFEDWTAKASEYCERFPNPRKAELVQRNLEAVQAALKEREKRQGASIEEIAEELQRKKATLDTAKRELRSLMSLNRALKKSVKSRLARWHEFRRHIALRCKVYFGYHLSNRGYFGKVLFDHVNGRLDLKVNTDDQNLTQNNNREKDPRSLSGGEKSFSTICLLLSLWESIGCPIRCLDEFDVFMDAVNRRISMRMMIDTANASNRKQYILITPQDMNNIHVGNTVRVHRMTDPERGQGVLAFS
ncbi:hypothetical protein GSI_15601 [Ganoderma sinense ZZ0214-1]|uniref:RecF/RecN/SMC N-terminal domain-containing protein n=1 Tax=Ganoderma sinense ZZ0214-1 TaxID=1077348 RepID=A0A2G8RN11_9APHY|nr:hypothetical protein GSI_15601 [Ganoderma sinense ZZ0214-1]